MIFSLFKFNFLLFFCLLSNTTQFVFVFFCYELLVVVCWVLVMGIIYLLGIMWALIGIIYQMLSWTVNNLKTNGFFAILTNFILKWWKIIKCETSCSNHAENIYCQHSTSTFSIQFYVWFLKMDIFNKRKIEISFLFNKFYWNKILNRNSMLRKIRKKKFFRNMPFNKLCMCEN